jgi:predicted RNA-binding Zn-ribbon protein involved in translation (DUF1610 family)
MMPSNHERHVRSATDDLLECFLCGNPRAVRTKAKLGDREAFSCPDCGDLDLTGSQLAELKAKRIFEALAAAID